MSNAPDPSRSAAHAGSLAIRAPDTSAYDERIAIRVTGAEQNERVDLRASLVDDDGSIWASHLTFTADEDGVVDLTEVAPDDGAYEDAEPMGWLRSMEPAGDEWLPRLETDPTIAIELRATAGDRTVERTIHREVYDAGISAQQIDRENFVGSLFVPAGDGPHPAVIDLHGGGGRLTVRTAKLLATEGYVTLALEYVGEASAIPDEFGRIPLGTFDDAAHWLLDQSTVCGDRVGLVGRSRGAELALLLGARYDWVGAVVSCAGSGVAWDTPSGDPAWIHDGLPVPHLTAEESPATRMERGVDDERIQQATAAVENTDGPILLISGDDDRVWPARRLSNVAIDRLDDAGFAYRYEHRTYDDVGHTMTAPSTPIRESLPTGGSGAATATAAEDSWPAILETLDRGLDN
ncbi:acyl-CoA thioester hydrolase/BAAT C-terminal domain-containing protein [Halovivax cerinus]|uniref:Acyl-CoA thioester hydrolase/BAAT C-terminal domain-containing protein n=1 Tax=Halovivax cerinus TaxID=1487865 RepID=A0ABD5NPG3_9EURY|nr:acyl-CoA thioesterase/bile acid-CoA:amino acid N-acyltransferase family protein [Halovivax cerinus]